MNRSSFIVLMAMLPLVSCEKDTPFNTSHPDKGAVVITPTWESALEDTDIPGTYRIFADDAETSDASLHAPGKHTLLIYNEPEGIQVDGHIASLERDADGAPCSMPGFLFSKTMEIDVPQDDTLRVEAPMERRICPVSILVRFEGDNSAGVEQVTGTLDGIAGSVDICQNALLGESVCLPAEVSVLEFEAAGTMAKLQWRILGIHPQAKQELTLHLKMKDGRERREVFDLSEHLQDVESMKPVELFSTVELTPDVDATL